MIDFILDVIGYFLIYTAIDVGRRPEDSIKTFSKNWWVTLVLVIIASVLIDYNG